MSALSALVGPDAAEASLRGLMRAQDFRGSDRHDAYLSDAVALGVSRYDWETADTHAGPAAVGRLGSMVAVVDGSIYYREELQQALRRAGVYPVDGSATTLVLAAFATWGGQLAEHIEGDYAFLVWDPENSRVVAGRDYVGKRALYSRLVNGRTWGFASSSAALAVIPPAAPVRRLLLAAATGGLMGGSVGSAFQGVDPVPAGSVWSFGREGRSELWRWQPPAFRSRGDLPTKVDWDRLKEAIARAVTARSVTPRTAVWLSGGMDSTAVFASGCSAAKSAGGDRSYIPISISYPEGDLACEDHHIAALTQQWGAEVHWLDSERIPLLERLRERSQERDDPYLHAFEPYNRLLGGSASRLGLTVSLDGHGGDFLFHVSGQYFPELLMTGQWRQMAGVFKEMGVPSIRSFLKGFVLPLLPENALQVVEALAGRKVPRPLEMHLPEWATASAAEQIRAAGWQGSEIKRRLLEAPAAFEGRWYLTSPFMPRSAAWIHTFSLCSGSELRSPLLDKTVMKLAADVPIRGRFDVNDQKPLLKAAMRGLMPESVLAPRPQKTGVPGAYFMRRMLEEFGTALESYVGVSGRGEMALADLGLVEREKFLAAWGEYQSTRSHLTGAQLLLTLGAEAWVRCHGGTKIA